MEGGARTSIGEERSEDKYGWGEGLGLAWLERGARTSMVEERGLDQHDRRAGWKMAG